MPSPATVPRRNRSAARLGSALMVATALLLFGLYTIRHIGIIARSSEPDSAFGLDFRVFYGGLFDFLQGGSLYNPVARLDFVRVTQFSNNLSPMGALFLLPLAALPYLPAVLLYTGLSYGFYTLATVKLLQALEWPKRLDWYAITLALIYASWPVYFAIQVGNWGLLVAAFDIFGWYCARKGYDRWAGVWLGVAVVVRWQPFPLFLLLLVKKRWTAAVFTVGTAAVIGLVSLLVFGFGNFLTFANLVLSVGGQNQTYAYDGSLHGCLIRFFNALNDNGLNLLWLSSPLRWSLSLLLVGLFLWRSRRLGWDVSWSLGLVTGLLVAPLSWLQYHPVLILPVILLVQKRLWWAVAPTLLVCFSSNIFLALDYEAAPLFYGTFLTGSLLVLYTALVSRKA